jgi:hypothetical protein
MAISKSPNDFLEINKSKSLVTFFALYYHIRLTETKGLGHGKHGREKHVSV